MKTVNITLQITYDPAIYGLPVCWDPGRVLSVLLSGDDAVDIVGVELVEETN